MVVLKRNRILEYLPNQVENVRRSYDYDTEERFQQAMDLLNDWIKKQNHFIVKDFDQTYLEMSLILSKGSVERAKKRIDKLCTLRTIMPELFRNYDIRNEFKGMKEYMQHCMMPRISKDFYRVAVYRITDDVKLDLMKGTRYSLASYEYMMMNDYLVGYDSILDFQKVGFGMVTKMNPIFVQKIMLTMLDTYGARLRSMHLINASKFVEALVTIFKSVLNEKLKERFQVHSSPETLLKFFDKDQLPADYGGTLPSIDHLHDLHYDELCSDKFVGEMSLRESYRTDESRRLGGKFNEEYMGMPGSFKTLTVD